MLRFLFLAFYLLSSYSISYAQCSSFSWEAGESNGYDLFPTNEQLSEFGGNPSWSITLNGGSSFELSGSTIHLNPNQLAEIGTNGALVCFGWGEGNSECNTTTCMTLVYQEGTLSEMMDETCEAMFSVSSNENGVVTFENMSSAANENTIYTWYFSDELGGSNDVSPTHTFNYSGPREVCLTMTNYEGDEAVCTSSYCETIFVALQEINCESGTFPVTVSIATCCEVENPNSAFFSFMNESSQYFYSNAMGLAPFEAIASHSFCIPEGCYTVLFDYSLMEQAAEQISQITISSPQTTSFTVVELWEGLYWNIQMCFGESDPCNLEITSNETSCGAYNFEIGSFVDGEDVTWFPGDDSGAVEGGHFFSHEYAEPGEYNVCAFYTSSNCPEGVELCTTINVASCNLECPEVIYGTELECGYFSFNIGNVQLGEAMWNFGDGQTYDGTPWAQHNYTEDGVYVVTATYYSQNCPDGVTLNYTVLVDCGNNGACPSEIWSGAGEGCGVMNFEIGSFVEGEDVTWFPGDDSGAVEGGHFFSHTYTEPGTYTVCAFYTTPDCPLGVELCKTITVESCNSECPEVIYGTELECGYFSFNIGNVQLGEAMWNFGDGQTYDGAPWAQHNYTEDGVYVVTATYYSQNCPDGVTLNYTVLVDCGNNGACPSEIWSGAGEGCGVMNFEIGSFVEGEDVTWFPGDDSGAVEGGHFFSHTYTEPGTYTVCAFYTTPDCPLGVELCKTITVESCNSECPEVIYGTELECGYFSFNIGNVQLGEAMWNFGDGQTYDGTPWAQHNYTEDGIYVVTATYYSQNCPDGVTLNYTVLVDCGNNGACPSEIWSGAGEGCGVMNFEIGSFVEGEDVTWFPGDDSGAVEGGHFFSHTYAEPGTYTVCAFYTTPDCPLGVELCKTITVESCNSECPEVIYGTELECGYFSFNIGNVQLGEAMWNFGDGQTYDGTPWAQHNYTEDGVYVVTATYFSQNCPDGVTLNYTVLVDCGSQTDCEALFTPIYTNTPGHIEFINNSIAPENAAYTWNYGNDSSSETFGGNVWYNENGLYEVCLNIEAPGCIDTYCLPVLVQNMETGCDGTEVVITFTGEYSDDLSDLLECTVWFDNIEIGNWPIEVAQNSIENIEVCLPQGCYGFELNSAIPVLANNITCSVIAGEGLPLNYDFVNGMTSMVGAFGVNLDCTIATEDVKSSQLSMYPNPANEMITISGLTENENRVISIFDISGKLVQTINHQGAIATIPLNQLTSGIYLLKMTNSRETITKRFEVIK